MNKVLFILNLFIATCKVVERLLGYKADIVNF